jgi:hypothetical protein
MAKYIVIYNDTYNDVEMHGFTLMTDKEADFYENLLESITWEILYPLTSNGELNYPSGNDLLSCIEFKEISSEEYKAMKKTFPNGFGTFINEEFLSELIDEEDDYEEDNDTDDEGYYDDYGTDSDDDY